MAGRYGRWSLRGVEGAVVARYFSRDGAEFVLDEQIREAVEFRYLNLAEDTYPSVSTGLWGMDLILCRNVLIYFSDATLRRAIHAFIEVLRPGGFLFLGHAESIIGRFPALGTIRIGTCIAYRKVQQ